MEYYYTPKKNIDEEKESLIIDDFEYKHLAKVLRKKNGDQITITDGCRNIYHCEISYIDSKNITCKILKKEFNKFEPGLDLVLCIAPLRNMDRLEFAIEKAVELGVYCIQPVTTEFTINKNILSDSKIRRINKIIIGAMGQSQRCLLPEFQKEISLNELADKTLTETNKIVMYESSNPENDLKQTSIKIARKENNKCYLLIGPEGGFSKKEIELLEKNNWKICSLGERKLRAETAAIVSVFNIISNY
ncbi:MAG TPA: RsmE family RNA methyltransferase [Ignavibacteria bacterium]|nr:RsmE family RNA methyltransferase [Ignavibacteria bacterium]